MSQLCECSVLRQVIKESHCGCKTWHMWPFWALDIDKDREIGVIFCPWVIITLCIIPAASESDSNVLCKKTDKFQNIHSPWILYFLRLYRIPLWFWVALTWKGKKKMSLYMHIFFSLTSMVHLVYVCHFHAGICGFWPIWFVQLLCCWFRASWLCSSKLYFNLNRMLGNFATEWYGWHFLLPCNSWLYCPK